MTTSETETESTERELAAHHEAGHACAAIARGGTITSCTIAGGHGGGHTQTQYRAWDGDLITWAGPWAAARLLVGPRRDAPWQFDGECDLELARDFEQGTDRVELQRLLGVPHDELPLDLLRAWDQQLEPLWPAITAVAQLLLAGVEVTCGHVEAAVETFTDRRGVPHTLGAALVTARRRKRPAWAWPEWAVPEPGTAPGCEGAAALRVLAGQMG